ncbi:VOC family protein [Paenibacillus flagellatus]|uniref:VOC family protein n=1 Tax=Paenibacillus flagellatus TaxID=2211139 RepID=UPI00130514CF|nr:VOC family protein [Paenibacillus flagellatus]
MIEPMGEKDNPLRLSGWVQFYHHVRDVDRAKRWYADVIGMEPSHEAEHGGVKLAFLRISDSRPNVEFALVQSDKENPKTHAVLDFRVDDLEAARARIAAKGVEVSDIRRVTETRRDVELIDPDGVPVLLHERVEVGAAEAKPRPADKEREPV